MFTFNKALAAAIAAGMAVEGTGLVTGSLSHWLSAGLAGLIAVAGVFGVTYWVPNKVQDQQSTNANDPMDSVWQQGVSDAAAADVSSSQ